MTRADIKIQYPYVRSGLAVKLGITCDKLGKLKDVVLEKPADWVSVGNGYRVSVGGLQKLVQWLENEGVPVASAVMANPPGPEWKPLTGTNQVEIPESFTRALDDVFNGRVTGIHPTKFEPVPIVASAIKVTRRALNPRIVLGELDGKTVRVMVRSNENFKPGMVIPAVAVDAAGGLYRCNRNAPRWLGRW